MQNKHLHTTFGLLALGASLVLGACATEDTVTVDATTPTTSATVAPAPETTTPEATTPETTAPETTQPAATEHDTTVPATTAPAAPETTAPPSPTTTPPAPAASTPTDLVAVDDEDELPCGPLPAIPDDAVVGDEFWFDLNGDGIDGDLLVAYQSNGVWRLRAEIETWENGPIAQSEVAIPDAGVHGVRMLGLADVDQTYGGDEIVATVGGGASTVEVGLFTFLEGGCLFRYQSEDGGAYSQLVGGTIDEGSGLICSDGWLFHTGYELAANGTYTVWSNPFQPVALGTIGIVPDLDGYYEEDLTFEEASADLFDCHGLTI